MARLLIEAATHKTIPQPAASAFLDLQLRQPATPFPDIVSLALTMFAPPPSQDAHQMVLLWEAVVAALPPWLAAKWGAHFHEDVRNFSDEALALTLGADPLPREKLGELIKDRLHKTRTRHGRVLVFAAGPVHRVELVSELPAGTEVHEADLFMYHEDTKVCDGDNPVDESNSYDVAGGSWLLGAPCEYIHKIVLDVLPAIIEGGLLCFAERESSSQIEIAYKLMKELEARDVLSDVRSETHANCNVRTISAVTCAPLTRGICVRSSHRWICEACPRHSHFQSRDTEDGSLPHHSARRRHFASASLERT